MSKKVIALRKMITALSKAIWSSHYKQTLSQDDDLVKKSDKHQTEAYSPKLDKNEYDKLPAQVPANSLESSLDEVHGTKKNKKKGKAATDLKSVRKSSDYQSSQTNQKV